MIENKEFMIVEASGPDDPMIESQKENDGKDLYIEGIFAQANKVNGNRRVYPKAVLEEAADVYMESQIKTHQALGELNHPLDRIEVDPGLASHIIEKMWWDGNNLMGRAKILGTNRGQTVRQLMEGGWIPGVSTRGTGKVKRNSKGINEVQPGYKMRVGVDIVHTPSAPDAYVEGIFECTESGLVLPRKNSMLMEDEEVFEHYMLLKSFKMK